MKAAFLTLGCKVNQCDTAELMQSFRSRGHEIVPFRSDADVYVVNTCTVTRSSDAKSRKAVHQARRRHPGAIVVATGCLAKVAPGSLGEASIVSDCSDPEGLVREVESLVEGKPRAGGPSPSFDPLVWRRALGRNRAFLKVQEGCEQLCTYCIVPYARGPSRSVPVARCVERALQLASAGFREIVLTGTHLGVYGRDLDPGLRLVDLVLALHRQLEGRARIRLSSIEPLEVTGELISAAARLSWMCPHFHIPVQSGSDRILSAMGRPYRSRDYLEVVSAIRKEAPDAALTTDVMVGFPGESHEDFMKTVDLVRKAGFSRLHVFRYSPRPGTPACAMGGKVGPETARDRSWALIELGGELALEFHRRHVGRDHEVLVEDEAEPETGRMQGLTRTYVRARMKPAPGLRNKLVNVKCIGADQDGIIAEPLCAVEVRRR